MFEGAFPPTHTSFFFFFFLDKGECWLDFQRRLLLENRFKGSFPGVVFYTLAIKAEVPWLAPEPALQPALGWGTAQSSAPQTPARGNAVPWGQKPLAATTRRGARAAGLLPTANPKCSAQLWPERQEADWEKVRGGVEGGGKKKFKEERLGGIACPHPPTGAWKGEDRGGWRRRARTGLLEGQSGAPELTPPKGKRGGWRPGAPRRCRKRKKPLVEMFLLEPSL